MKRFIASVALVGCWIWAAQLLSAQGTANLRGLVVEQGSRQPLGGVVVKVANADTLYGAITDSSGKYIVENVPFGRYDVTFSFVGFLPHRVTELLLATRSGADLNAELEEASVETETVQIFSTQKWDTRNDAALVSGRSFTGEELSRVAGGIDDPARVASRLPGVIPASALVENSIQVRGNPSRAVLWRLEGIDIYNPNHFGRLENSGGIITLFSQQLLAQTDFFTAAFPADYGNALGSVFDVRFRNGSRDRHHATFQIGILGVDAALEGPIGKSKRTSYLFNYRYSTTGIADYFLQIGSIPIFQDLSFKIHHEFKSGAQLNFFGVGGKTVLRTPAIRDTTVWDSVIAANTERNSWSYVGSLGLNYTLPIGAKTYLQAVAVGSGIEAYNYQFNLDRSFNEDTIRKGESTSSRLSTHIFVNHKFGPRHTHRTGFLAHRMHADIFYISPPIDPNATDTLYNGAGASYLFQGYTRSQFRLGPRLRLHAGLHSMRFSQTREWTLEPRFGARYLLSENQALSFGYGLHSQMEPFFLYVTRTPDENGVFRAANADLGFNRSQHFVLSYQWRFNDHWRFLAEAYYQPTFRMAVVRDLPVSRLGAIDFQFEAFDLVTSGSSRTYGIDLSIERSLHKGWYFMLNGSLLDSEWQDNLGNTHVSSFDVGYMFSLMGGKEFYLKPKKNKTRILGLNIAGNFTGTQYYTGIDLPASIAAEGYVTDYANVNAFRRDPMRQIDVGLTYRVSRPKVSTLFSLQIKNILNQRILLSQTFDWEKQEAGENLG
ncbi:MAG: TonB-dependent receptor, partial [Bacteroidota bacterium]